MDKLRLVPLVLALAACSPDDKDTATSGASQTGGTDSTDGTDSASGTGSTSEATGLTTGSTTMAVDPDCAYLVGKTYLSEEVFNCSFDPDKPMPCQNSVEFLEGMYYYNHGDLSEDGTYTCEGDTIIGIPRVWEDVHMGTIMGDDASKLVWQDLVYYLEQ